MSENRPFYDTSVYDSEETLNTCSENTEDYLQSSDLPDHHTKWQTMCAVRNVHISARPMREWGTGSSQNSTSKYRTFEICNFATLFMVVMFGV